MEYMTVRQAAEYLGVSEESIRYWIKEKGLPSKRRGLRGLVVLKSDLREFAKANGMIVPYEPEEG